MKKVRYAAGAAGIIPTVGLMLPSAAMAATQAAPATVASAGQCQGGTRCCRLHRPKCYS